VGPVIGWQLAANTRVSFGEGFGLNDYSLDHIVRVGLAYEVGQLFHRKGDHR
jgi:hypothetical protein